MILALKDYDACYAALKKTRQVVTVLEAAREDAQLASELSTANDKLFGVFALAKLAGLSIIKMNR